MASLFEAYITNLGKYNEGELVGETLKFPTTTEEVQALLKRIGVDGVRYEEFFITSFDGDVLGLYDYLTEYENLDELNHLACLLSELDQGELEKFEAVIDSGEHTSSVADLINLAQNLDCYEFYPGVEDDETLGRIYVEDMEAIDVPEHLLNYFDYEAYGRDIALGDTGAFTDYGYVYDNQSRFEEYYDGDRENIPEEYRVMVSPEDVEELEPDFDRLDVSTELALDLDLHFRGYSADYEQAFPKEQVQREAIADASLTETLPLSKPGFSI